MKWKCAFGADVWRQGQLQGSRAAGAAGGARGWGECVDLSVTSCERENRHIVKTFKEQRKCAPSKTTRTITRNGRFWRLQNALLIAIT